MTSVAHIDPIAYQREAARRHFALRRPENKARSRIQVAPAPLVEPPAEEVALDRWHDYPPAVEPTPRAFMRRRCRELDIRFDRMIAARDMPTSHLRQQLMWEVHCAFPKLSLPRIGQHFQRNHTTVIYALEKFGYVCKPAGGLPAETREKARFLLLAGQNQSQTARALGITPTAVRYWIKKFGWEQPKMADITPRPCPLTQSEHKIVQLLANGRQAKEIAHVLALKLHTINDYIQDAKRKAGASTRDELVAISLRQRWIE